MTAWLLAQIAPYLAAAGAIIGALFWARRSGKRDAKREAEIQTARDRAETLGRMSDADATLNADPDKLRDWLKERAERGRGAH